MLSTSRFVVDAAQDGRATAKLYHYRPYWPSSRKRRGNVLKSIATALFCFYLLTQEAEKMTAFVTGFPPALAGLGQLSQAGEQIIPINGLGLWGLGLIGLAMVLAIRQLVRAMRRGDE